MKKRIILAAALTLGLTVLFVWNRFSATWFGPRPSIELRWVPAFEAETWPDVRTGIAWSLSFLGATLPKGSLDRCIVRRDRTHFRLDLAPAGFGPEALRAFQAIIDELARSDEYRKTGSVDLGRFLVLTLHSSWHYYAITGAQPTLRAFLDHYQFTSFDSFAVVNSAVAHDQRVLRLKPSDDALSMAFVAEEGHGSTEAGTFEPQFYEVVTLQSNGQFRFAVYDRQGRLSAASPRELSTAGKPSKCLWCHEINVHGFVIPTPDVAGYLTRAEAGSAIERCTQSLKAYRKTLSSEIDYAKTQDHSFSEFLYETFMEPSPFRIASEWNVPLGEVVKKLNGLEPHRSEESPVPEPTYRRAEVDDLAPYQSVQVPESIREPSLYEPDFVSVASKITGPS